MYYNKINDSEIYTYDAPNVKGFTPSYSAPNKTIAEYIQSIWIDSRKIPAKHIIAGLSFGNKDVMQKSLPSIAKVAQGGISVWGKNGGKINYYGDCGSRPSPTPGKTCDIKCKIPNECTSQSGSSPYYTRSTKYSVCYSTKTPGQNMECCKGV